MRLGWLTAVAASAVLALRAATAQPAPGGDGFFVGFSEYLPRVIGAEAVEPGRDLGAKAFRITLDWKPGQLRVADNDAVELERAVRAAAGMKVVLAVYSLGTPASAPQTDVARGE